MSFWGHEPLANISADTAAAEVEQGAQLVDIGTPQDWFAGHLPGATLVEPELIDNVVKELAKDKRWWRDVAAAGAAAAFHDHGFEVAILEGGPHAWTLSGRHSRLPTASQRLRGELLPQERERVEGQHGRFGRVHLGPCARS